MNSSGWVISPTPRATPFPTRRSSDLGASTVAVGAIGTVTANGINTVALTGTTVTLNGNITTDNTNGNSATMTGAALLGTAGTNDTSANVTDQTGAISFTSTINGGQAL